MKTLYKLNEVSQRISTDLVEDDYKITGELETCVPVPDGLYEPQTFNKITQTWTGITREEWLANQPEPDPKPSAPSPEMLAINALGIQLAKHLAGGD